MSLTVPAAVQERAVRAEVPAEEFVAVVRDSLPYAYWLATGAAGAGSPRQRRARW